MVGGRLFFKKWSTNPDCETFWNKQHRPFSFLFFFLSRGEFLKIGFEHILMSFINSLTGK